MKYLILLVATVVQFSGIVLADTDSINANTCDPPEFTYPLDGDTVHSNMTIPLKLQFRANTGGVGDTGKIVYWQKLSGVGSLNRTLGLFTFFTVNKEIYSTTIEVTNDCETPLKDTITFFIDARFERASFKEDDGIPNRPFTFFGNNRNVYGSPDAESLSVVIVTYGSTIELESLGIQFRERPGKNAYDADVSLEQWRQLHRLQSVKQVMIPPRGGAIHQSVKSPALDSSIGQDTSTVPPPTKDGFPFLPFERDRYLSGPPGEERLDVLIETDGSTAELEELGIEFREWIIGIKNNMYLATVTIQQYRQLRSLKTVIQLIPRAKQYDIHNSISSPEIDTNKSR